MNVKTKKKQMFDEIMTVNDYITNNQCVCTLCNDEQFID